MFTGEASGDLHGAGLIKALRKRRRDFNFYGIGGEHMRAAGVEIIVDAAELAVMGLFEVVAHFPRLYSSSHTHAARITGNGGLIYWCSSITPDFNLRLAKTAKQLDIKVLYYISPQVWAWRRGRVHKIGRRIDHMAVIFPFEVAFYEQAGIPVTFVGHPLAHEVSTHLTRTQARESFGLTVEQPVLALLPGSRRGEIERLLPPLLASARQLRHNLPLLQIVPDTSDHSQRQRFAAFFSRLS